VRKRVFAARRSSMPNRNAVRSNRAYRARELIIIRLVENGRGTLMRFSRSSADFHADSIRDCFSEFGAVCRALTLTIVGAAKKWPDVISTNFHLSLSPSLSLARAPRFVRTRYANRDVNLVAEWRLRKPCSEGQNLIEGSPGTRVFELLRILE